MKTRVKRDARLLLLFAVLAALPLAIWACSDAGDGPGGPTGPSSTYDPKIDYAGATITARTEPSEVAPGGMFTILAYFKDANGLPVEGVPLSLFGDGGASLYFSPQTNPTLTAANGGASINVDVSASTPNGSYAFVIGTSRSQSALGHVGITVGGAAGTPTVTGITLTTPTPSVVAGTDANFIATATATPSCTVGFLYQVAGAGLTVGWTPAPAGTTNPWLFSLTPTSAGTMTVLAAAYCLETGEGKYSDPVNVTVSAAP